MAGTKEVNDLSVELSRKLSKARKLSDVKASGPSPPPIQWSLLLNTSHDIGPAAQHGLSALCCTVMDQVSLQVLESRGRLLEKEQASHLRTFLWISVNQWLSWDRSSLKPVLFNYWDGICDKIPEVISPYSEERLPKMQKLYQADVTSLGELGNFLTTSPALCNNPDSGEAHRVISGKVKDAIDTLMEV